MKLLIDCDPGIDDAIALTMAIRNASIELLGVTTVFGNGGLAQTIRNAEYILTQLGAKCSVVPGSSKALLVEYAGNGSRVHGSDGMGEVLVLPELAQLPEKNEAIHFLCETLRESKERVTLVALGALTNLALLCKVAPELLVMVERVVVMGGVFDEVGNIRPHAEANVFNDPHAAQIVISANWTVHLVPLDVTKRVVIDGAQFDAALRATGDSYLVKLAACTQIYRRFHEQKYGFDGFFAHDPTALTTILAPDKFTWREQAVRVRLEGERFGATQVVADGAHIMVCESELPLKVASYVLESLVA